VPDDGREAGHGRGPLDEWILAEEQARDEHGGDALSHVEQEHGGGSGSAKGPQGVRRSGAV
jgi:hypothetical protein